MIYDLYVKDYDEPNYNSKKIELYDPLQIVVQKVRMILMTNKGDFIGDPNFGCNLEQYIFEMDITQAELEREIDAQIVEYVAEDSTEYDIKVKVTINYNTLEFNTAILDVYINNMILSKMAVKRN